MIHNINVHPVNLNLRFPPLLKRCLFCNSNDRDCFTEEEHAFPESIGNKRIILPPGVVCDNCNGHFSGLENQFIHSAPMFFYRCFYEERTKKNKWPKSPLPDGFIEGSRRPHDPMPVVNLTFNSVDREEWARLIAQVRSNTNEHTLPSIRLPKDNIQETSRVLAKIALELAYLRFPRLAFSQACDDIRRFARRPRRNEYLPYAWSPYLGERFQFEFVEELAAFGISVGMAAHFTMPGARYLVPLTPLGASTFLTSCAELLGLSVRTEEEAQKENALRIRLQIAF